MRLFTRERILATAILAVTACSTDDDDPSGDTEHAHAATDDDEGADDDAAPTGDGPSDDGPATTAGPGDTSDGADADDVDDGSNDDDSGDDGSDDGAAGVCTDQLILDLGLVEGLVSTGEVADAPDGDGWISTVDATAGGITEAPTQPWIYLRFSPEGLQKVALDDLQALDSTEWDIAAKRSGLRLNSGPSGPSTVSAAALVDATYEDVTELPEGTTFSSESFYDGDCTLIDDGSGQGAPNYALTPWWFYPGCVGTTLVPFVLELPDGAHVKLVVEAYYEEGQAMCNEGGAMGTTSAMYTWRWAYLPRDPR
jgi:hypothetical protein